MPGLPSYINTYLLCRKICLYAGFRARGRGLTEMNRLQPRPTRRLIGAPGRTDGCQGHHNRRNDLNGMITPNLSIFHSILFEASCTPSPYK